MKRIILLITMLLMCGIASAGFQPYDIFAIVWNNETGAPEPGVDVTFTYNNQSFTLTTAEDGSVDFATQNFNGELPDGALINVSCKYGTKQAQIVSGDAGFGVTFNEPSEASATAAFAAMGIIAIALGGGLYLLRRKKTIKQEEINMTNETTISKLKRDFGVRALIATLMTVGYIGVSGIAAYNGNMDMLENISKIFMPIMMAIVVFYYQGSSIRDAIHK